MQIIVGLKTQEDIRTNGINALSITVKERISELLELKNEVHRIGNAVTDLGQGLEQPL